MQVTFDSEEPLERVLAVVSSLYDVRLEVAEQGEGAESGERTVKTRHLL